MKKILVFLPVVLLSSLTACGGVDTAHAVASPINYDAKIYKTGVEAAFEIGPYALYDMLNNKESFVIEFYSPTCGSCQVFEPVLSEYINKTNFQWYRFNTRMNKEDEEFFIDVVMEEHKDTLGGLDSVPSVYYIKEGKLSYEVNYQKFSSYTAFSKIANKHFIRSSMYTVSTLKGLESYLCDYKDTVLYVYDNTSTVSNDVYQTIYSKSQGKRNSVIILYKNSMKQEDYMEISTKLGHNYTDNFACLIEGGEIKKTVDYTSDGGASFKEYITSYLG